MHAGTSNIRHLALLGNYIFAVQLMVCLEGSSTIAEDAELLYDDKQNTVSNFPFIHQITDYSDIRLNQIWVGFLARGSTNQYIFAGGIHFGLLKKSS